MEAGQAAAFAHRWSQPGIELLTNRQTKKTASAHMLLCIVECPLMTFIVC
jgi:hypothetical protein